MQSKRFLTLLVSLASGLAAAQENMCAVSSLPFPDTEHLKAQQTEVKAQRTEIQQDRLASFSGDVDILNQDARITAQQATLDKQKQRLTAEQGVSYQDQQMLVSSDHVDVDMATGQLVMENTHYQLTQLNGKGDAKTIRLSQQEGVLLEDVSFSTCPIGNEDWRIEASSIELGAGNLWGEATHTRFYIRDVPVLYLPYFAFPVTDLRQTGLLFPKMSSSSSTGISYEQPFYWNIAPNFDATIGTRLMSERGSQFKGEFRYLTEHQAGQINVEYLANDRKLDNSDARYFYRYTHTGDLSDRWTISTELNGLSDDNYIVDFGSDYYNRADTHLYKTLALNYYSDQLDVNFQTKDFEIIGDHPSTYRALPELRLNYHQPLLGALDFRLNAQAAHFSNQEQDAPEATRIHLAPTLALPYNTNWGEFIAEAGILHTRYNQSHIDGTELAEDVTRNLSRARIYGGLTFERPTDWFGINTTQTLEPKIQYLYTSYQDQSEIGLYDTTPLLNDFEGLFRGEEFTGLDRISDKNQLTLGVTSRFLDDKNREQFKLSLGQTFYLADNRLLAAAKEENRSALAAEVDWQMSSKWFAHSEVQISTLTDKLERSNLSLEYQLADNKLLQINHRYVRELSDEKISQLGVTASWPIAENWQWVSRWYRDVDRHRTIETYTGVEYESCCWSVRMIAQRHLTNRYDSSGLQSTNEFDSGVSLQFIFKGFGRSNGSRDMLKDGLFGYRQPYLMN